MCRIIFVLVFINFWWDGIQCDISNNNTKPENLTAVIHDTPFYRRNSKIIFPDRLISARQEPAKVQDELENDKVSPDGLRRKSKFLGSLAFLAGLSVGGLASSASSNVKSFVKLPQASVSVNLGPSRLNPYLAALYDPYLYPTFGGGYPFYYYSSNLGLMPYPGQQLPLFTGGQAQNNFASPLQTPPSVSQELPIFDNGKRPIDESDPEEEYIEEHKKTENDNHVEDEVDDRIELRVQNRKNAEEKMTVRTVPPCVTSKSHHRKNAHKRRGSEDLEEEADDSQSATRAGGMGADLTTTTASPLTPTTTSETLTTTTTEVANATMNSTSSNNNTGYPPPIFGYYGGNPQQIDHIDFTTEPDLIRHDYNHINYNLPFDRPANFNPYDNYEPIPHSSSNSFPTNVIPTNSLPINPFPTNALPTNAFPTNVLPPNTFSSNTFASNSFPSNVYSSNSFPVNSFSSQQAYQTNSFPSNNNYPSNSFPSNSFTSNSASSNQIFPDQLQDFSNNELNRQTITPDIVQNTGFRPNFFKNLK